MFLDAEQQAMRERQQSNQRRLEVQQAQEVEHVKNALAASGNGRNRKKLRAALKLPPPPVVLPEPVAFAHISMNTAQSRFAERIKTSAPLPSAVANSALLREFKQQVKEIEGKFNRILLLQTYAAIVVVLRDDKDLRSARRSFNSIKHSRFRLEGQKCWSCGAPAEVRHHVIQLQHGGLITSSKNIKLLCNQCHTEVHPWLAVPISPPISALEMLNKRIDQMAQLFCDAAKGTFKNQREIENASLEVLDNFFNVVNLLNAKQEI